MKLSICPRQLDQIADSMRRRLEQNDLIDSLPTVAVGYINPNLDLAHLSMAAAGFRDALADQITVIANAFTLGADDAKKADVVAT